MSKSFKQQFIKDMIELVHSVSVSPEPGRILVSQPLYDAIREIEAEVTRDRTNWKLVTALTGVKSYISGVTGNETWDDPFWEQIPATETEEPSIYGILDDLHFRASTKVGRLSSGSVLYFATPTGIAVEHGEVQTDINPDSPTLRLIAEECARIEADAAKMAAKQRDDLIPPIPLVVPPTEPHQWE